MKTLNEQIADIKNAKTSRTAKRLALIQLGLQPYEVTMVLASLPKAERNSFTFGVEIECGVNPDRLREAASETGFSYNYEGYNHHDGHAYFKFVSDGSLRLADAIECVSPVLKGNKGRDTLKNACRTLNAARARVNQTCGLHVHIGASDLNESQYDSVFINYAHLEKVIDTFMAESRRGNNAYYAASIRHCLPRILERGAAQAFNNRYHKVNAFSRAAHGTIEFRQHQGTTNFDKIDAWVRFCGKLVKWSKTHRLERDVESLDEIEFLTAKEKAFFKARIAELNA